MCAYPTSLTHPTKFNFLGWDQLVLHLLYTDALSEETKKYYQNEVKVLHREKVVLNRKIQSVPDFFAGQNHETTQLLINKNETIFIKGKTKVE